MKVTKLPRGAVSLMGKVYPTTEIDRLVYAYIDRWKPFGCTLAGMSGAIPMHSTKTFSDRVIDRSLQRMHRAGKIWFDLKFRNWKTVASKP